MRTILFLCVIAALMASVVSAETDTWNRNRSREVAPIIGAPASNLKKPIIYTPPRPKHAPPSDRPLTGAPPANLKKVNVTANLYGGSVEWRRGRDGRGCPCRELANKFRYDAEFKDRRSNRTHRGNGTRCGCHKKKAAPSPLPPVIARLKRRARNHTRHNGTCHKPKAKKRLAKVVPLYYPAKKHRKHHKKPCNATTPAKPPTIQPQFYPTWAERRKRRKARRSRRKARKGKKKL